MVQILLSRWFGGDSLKAKKMRPSDDHVKSDTPRLCCNRGSERTVVRWLPTDIKEDELDALSLPTGAKLAYDLGKNPVVLFQNEWSANYFGETNKNCPLSALPVQTARE